MGPADGTSADLLLQRADVAMYVAKDAHSGVNVYSSQLDPNTPDHLALLGDLRHAVTRQEFVLHYQPKALDAVDAGLGRRSAHPLAAPRPTGCSTPIGSSPRPSGPV